jgi:hypothetical protein
VYDEAVRGLILRVMTAIQLTRLTMGFGAVADIWFVILLTQGRAEYVYVPVHSMDLAPALVGGAIVAIGLFAYGASLNDVLDARHDSTFSPDRPIPAGRIKLGQAVVVTIGSLIVAVLAGAALGTAGDRPSGWPLYITLLTAAAILFYNAAGKYLPAVGLMTLGLIHAAHIFIPNHQLTFTLPVWLVMTHSVGIAAAVHVLEDKRPRLTRRTVIALFLGWVGWSVIIVGAGALGGGLWPVEAGWPQAMWPIAAVVGFMAIGWWKASSATGRAAAEKLKRYGAMWHGLYGAGWLAAVGLGQQALGLLVFALVGFAAMTVIKEISGLATRPLAYRS